MLRRFARCSALILTEAALAACARERTAEVRREPARVTAATVEPPPSEGPVRMEEVTIAGDLPAFALRGPRGAALDLVFVPGMCVHPLGYAQAFQFTAAEHGPMIAVQGDLSCGDDGSRRWSSDLAAMDRRIDAAWRAAYRDVPREITLVGYSQGAERAEALAARWPAKYTHLVLIASPITPSPSRLRRARAVVLMAGTWDVSRPRMRADVEPFRRAGVASTFIEIPNAQHGGMGDAPEVTMDEALDFAAAE